MNPTNDLTYESAMQQLESITARLETGSLPLQESLQLYEKATSLVRFCNTCLDNAQQTVVKLSGSEAQYDN